MKTAIETSGLVRRYGKKTVINGLNLSVPVGSVYGFLGKNGAGKTTTIRMLMGLIRRHGGSVSVLGLDPDKEDVKVKSRVGYVAESPDFYDWLTVEKTIGLVANYHPRWHDRTAEQLVKAYGLELTSKVGSLSKGNRAKLSLLLALAHKPELLILDEPIGGLDPGARRDFMENVLRTLPDEGCTVFISSHLVNEISGLVDRVGFLKSGTLSVDEKTEDLLASVKLVRLVFSEGDIPSAVEVKGLMRTRTEGRELLLTVRHFDPEKTLQEVRRYSPSDVTVEPLTLEDVFIELLPDEEAT